MVEDLELHQQLKPNTQDSCVISAGTVNIPMLFLYSDSLVLLE